MRKEELAFNIGYRVTDCGRVFNPSGYDMKISSKGNKRYPQINFKYEDKKYSVRMHRLAAYCFYGEQLYNPGVLVRHLNDVKIDICKDNIALGTQFDNMNDISADKLRVMSEKKRRYALDSGVKPPITYKIPDSEIPTILALLDEGYSQRKVALKYEVHHSTISYIHTNRRHTHAENKCS